MRSDEDGPKWISSLPHFRTQRDSKAISYRKLLMYNSVLDTHFTILSSVNPMNLQQPRLRLQLHHQEKFIILSFYTAKLDSGKLISCKLLHMRF